ncbi:MAG TPA: DUF1653 domain-containing protein [Candidatus Saccharimonadales bacterium]|nr:DUF1653 domain-containing protein [Candidatus Saccharimonadales bacterium]
MNKLQAGVYKHYKGGLVYVLGVANHSETKEKFVSYIELSGKAGAKIWVRPYRMFFEEVIADGVMKPRFAYIGETVEPVFAKFYDPLGGYSGADRVDD